MQHVLRTNFILILQMNQKHFFFLINLTRLNQMNQQ